MCEWWIAAFAVGVVAGVLAYALLYIANDD